MISFPKSISGRLFLWLFSFVTILLVAVGFALYHETKRSTLDSIDNSLHSDMQIFIGLLRHERGTVVFEHSEVISGDYAIPRSGHYYKVVVNGKVSAASPSLVDESFNLASGRLERQDRAQGIRMYASRGPAKEPIRVMEQRIKVRGVPVTVDVGKDLREAFDSIAAFRNTLFIAIPLSVLTVGLIGLLIARKSMEPLKNFSDTVSRITYENLNERLDAGKHAKELWILSGAFNRMLERLQNAFRIEQDNERKKAELATVNRLMVTLSHYLLNSNTIIGASVRRCRKAEPSGDVPVCLDMIEEQAKKTDAVIAALRKVTQVKTADYTANGHDMMIDITEEIETQLEQGQDKEGQT